MGLSYQGYLDRCPWRISASDIASRDIGGGLLWQPPYGGQIMRTISQVSVTSSLSLRSSCGQSMRQNRAGSITLGSSLHLLRISASSSTTSTDVLGLSRRNEYFYHCFLASSRIGTVSAS